MTKTNDKPKPKFLVSVNKKTRLSVQISQKTMSLIEDYQKFHAEISGEKVSLDDLVSAVISTALTSDKSFLKWKKDKSKAGE